VLLRGLSALCRSAAKVAASNDPRRDAALARLGLVGAKARIRIALHGTWQAPT